MEKHNIYDGYLYRIAYIFESSIFNNGVFVDQDRISLKRQRRVFPAGNRGHLDAVFSGIKNYLFQLLETISIQSLAVRKRLRTLQLV